MVKQYPRGEPKLRGKLRTIARQMRHEPTPAEDFLWQQLRNRRLGGFRVHRQHMIDRFIVDLVYLREAIIIEVDGEIHQQQIDVDLERSHILTALGYRIMRFTNTEVLEDMDNVLTKILHALQTEKGP